MAFTMNSIPPCDGKTFLVTGANSGLGYETCLALARRGANVKMACRSPERAAAAVERIREAVPDAKIEVLSLDLGDLASVARCAEQVAGTGGLDVLINNAGIMAVPPGRTVDGFELQFGTNHLGHFALTLRLLPTLRDRVVTVTSTVARIGSMPFDNLHGEKSYNRWAAYARSKLANQLFTLELARRLEAAGDPRRALSAHPGYAATELQKSSADQSGSWFEGAIMALGNFSIAMSAANGALPQLLAATMPDAPNGALYGPWIFGSWGAPALETPPPQARDAEVAARLWELSETATGVRFVR